MSSRQRACRALRQVSLLTSLHSNLGWQTDDGALKHCFEKHVAVVQAVRFHLGSRHEGFVWLTWFESGQVVEKDSETGRSRGRGFVRIYSEEDAATAVKELNGSK